MTPKAIIVAATVALTGLVCLPPAASAQTDRQATADALHDARSGRLNLLAAGVLYRVLSEACNDMSSFEQSLSQAESVDERFPRTLRDESSHTGIREEIETAYSEQWVIDGEAAITVCNEANFTGAKSNFHDALDLYAESVAELGDNSGG